MNQIIIFGHIKIIIISKFSGVVVKQSILVSPTQLNPNSLKYINFKYIIDIQENRNYTYH